MNEHSIVIKADTTAIDKMGVSLKTLAINGKEVEGVVKSLTGILTSFAGSQDKVTESTKRKTTAAGDEVAAAAKQQEASQKLVLTFESQINALKAVQSAMAADIEIARSGAVQRRLYNSALASGVEVIDSSKIALAKEVEGMKQSNAVTTALAIATNGLTDAERKAITAKAQHAIEVKKVTDAVKAEYVASQQAVGAADAHIVAYNREIAASRTYQEQLGKEIIQLQKRELSGTGLSAGNKTLFAPIGQDPNVIRAHNAALSTMNGTVTAVAQSTSIMDKYSHQFMRTLVDLTPIISGLGLLTLAHGAIQATDQYTKLTSQLKTATNSTSEYAFAMSEVKRISSAAQVDINAIGSLYQRLSLATQASGTSQKEVALITETVSLGLKANGASARESASAMLQLSQSFGSGRMAGEEFNSMAEAAPNVLRALATSMGVPYGALKQLASEGKITTEVMVKAFTDPKLLSAFQAQASSMRTITGSWVELTNALVLYVGEGSKSSGVTKILSGALSLIADNLKFIGDAVIFVASAMAIQLSGSILKAAADLVLLEGAATKAMAKLTALSVTTKGGLIGLALFAAYEVADYMGLIDRIFAGTEERIKKLRADILSVREIESQKKTKTGNDNFNVVPGLVEDAVAVYAKSIGKISGDMSNFIKDGSFIFSKDFLSKEQEKAAKIKELSVKLNAEIDKLWNMKNLSIESRIKDEIQLRETYAEKVAELNKKETTSAQKAAEAAAKEVVASQSKIAVMNIEMGTGHKLTESQKELIKLGFEQQQVALKTTESKYIENKARLTGVAITEAEKVALAAAKKEEEDAIQRRAVHLNVMENEIVTIDKKIESAKFENSIIGATKEQIALLKAEREGESIAILEKQIIQLEDNKNSAAEISLIEEKIKRIKELRGIEVAGAAKQAKQAEIDAEKAANKKLWTDIDGFAHTAFNNITMKGKNAFAEIGKAIKESILDMLYKMTIHKWIFQIGGVSGGVAGAGVAGATDMFGGGSGGGGGLGGLVNAGSNLYSAFSSTGSLASTAGSYGAFAASSIGQALGLSELSAVASTTAAIGTEVAASLTTFGAAIPYVGAAIAVLSLLGSFSSSSTSITGSGLNIAGKVGAPSTSGYTTGVTNESSWWGLDSSSSSWRTGSAASKETSLAISNMFAQIRSAIVLSGAAIGKDATALDNQIANYTISIGDLSLAGMDAAKQQEAITKAVSGMADSMVAQLVPGMERFQQANETLLQTLVRVATEVMTLNGFYLSLGVTTRATTASADKLSVALGGVAQASTLMTSFVAGFAPEAQKTALALGTLKSAGLGVAEFLTTTQSWWEFAKVASADQLTAILKNQDVIKSWVTAMDVSSKAVQDNITALQNKAIADFNAARQATDSLRAFAMSVRELQRSLWVGGQTPLTSTYGVTREQFTSTNTLAGQGNLTAQGNLASSATTFLDAAKKQAVSAIEYARDFAFVQNSLDATATLTENAVSVADLQLEELKKSNAWLAALDSKSASQTQSLEYLLGAAIASSEAARMSVVEQAITKLTSEIAGAVGGTYSQANLSKTVGAAGETALSYAGTYKTVGGSVNAAGVSSGISTTVSAVQGAALEAKRISDEAVAMAAAKAAIPATIPYSASNPDPTHVAAKASALAAMNTALSKYNPDHPSAFIYKEYISAKLKYDALPAFATGINEVPFDMTARIHAGEEIKPRAYVEKDKEDKKETNELLRKLVAANDEMKKELIAIKSTNYKMAVIEDRREEIGMPSERLAA